MMIHFNVVTKHYLLCLFQFFSDPICHKLSNLSNIAPHIERRTNKSQTQPPSTVENKKHFVSTGGFEGGRRGRTPTFSRADQSKYYYMNSLIEFIQVKSYTLTIM